MTGASPDNIGDDAVVDPNRFEVLGDSVREFETYCRDQTKALTLLIIGLDHFDKINESFGYRIGDLLLTEIEARLGKVVANNLFNRCGGAEFVVILPVESVTEPTVLVHEILQAIHRPFRIGKSEIGLVARIGLALSERNEIGTPKLWQRARIALSVARNARKEYVFYSPEHSEVETPKALLTADLRHAIDEDQLFLLYQPKIDLKTGRVTGVEALVRWQHPQLGIVVPDQFIPLAEETGMITQLTRSVLHKVLQQCQEWNHAGMGTKIATNLSMWDLQDNGCADQIPGLLASYGVSPSQIGLEVAETAIMTNSSRAINALQSMRKMGVEISIDDFGTGYSSLAHLKNLPVNEIKIDRSFVTNMAEDKEDAVIVQSVIDLAHKFGLKVVAEGVENRKTKAMLDNLKCDTAQGFYISKPVSSIEFKSWLSKHEESVSQQTLVPDSGNRWLEKLFQLNPFCERVASF